MRAPSWVRPNRIALALLCATASLSVAPTALANGAAYRLEVVRGDGAGSCPSASVIEQDVRQRLHRDPFADTGERGIEVLLERTDSGFRAKLYLRIDAASGDEAARSIESTAVDCSELGKSVALAVALAIAPELPPELPPAPKPVLVCPKPALPPPQRTTLHGAASLRLLFSPSLLPHGAFGTALAVTLRGELVGANVGGLFYSERELNRSDAHVGFGISAAFASGCLWARTRQPQVWSCIGARVGALHSVVYAPEPNRTGDHFWLAATSELGVRQELGGRVFIELGAAALFPLIRQRFEVESSLPSAEPARLVYEQGPAAVEGLVGLGLRLD